MKKTRVEREHFDLTLDNTRKIEGLIDVVNDIIKDNPDYQGGLSVRITTGDDKSDTYYMVSDMFINDPFLEFYHLVPSDESLISTMSLKSFPVKPDKQKIQTYIKGLYKNSRWNRVHEQFNLSNVLHIQTIGQYSYSKSWRDLVNKHVVTMEKANVVSLKEKRGG